ncbi:hypothetical protein COCNU_08G003240 [Cocos nucifera]|uniref:Uncharacterized protein n=1 Tax=Cocos nucifera TaxID=13894 RepID=A0A8K0IH18_COCNU|nr:hypothetical protein COCNU_08G003240 [Cocos nucifera]
MAKGKRERRILAFTGAAALVAVGLNLLISAINAQKAKKKKRVYWLGKGSHIALLGITTKTPSNSFQIDTADSVGSHHLTVKKEGKGIEIQFYSSCFGLRVHIGLFVVHDAIFDMVRILAFTGAAALVAVGLNLLISAINAQKAKKKKRVIGG